MARIKGFPDQTPPTRAERVFAAIDEQFDDPEVTAGLIGLEAGIGGRRVKGILEEEGTSLRIELLKRRMEKADELLSKTSYAITHVAALCGYKDASAFARRFAEHDPGGRTPMQYRVAHGGKRRAGGATGAFRKPAARARALREGEVPPSMAPWRALPGSNRLIVAEFERERRRALLQGKEPPKPPPSLYSSEEDDPFMDAYIDAYLDQVLDEELT
jgi:AraC-like DNA-binding protein